MEKISRDQIGQETHGIPFGGTDMEEKHMDFRSHVTMTEVQKRQIYLACRRLIRNSTGKMDGYCLIESDDYQAGRH